MRATTNVLALAAALHAMPAATRAQSPAQAAQPVTGSIAGTVLTSATDQPIAGAAVVLEAARDAALVRTGETFLGRSLTAVTDGRGAYRFDGVPPGSYRLLVRHLGYRAAVIEIELARAALFRLSVGLEVNPIRLETVDVRGAEGEPYGRTQSVAEEADGRLRAERYRREQFVEGDAAVLTHADVVEAVTLGETDLFRAVQHLPSATTRDDWTAALWTRGAPWSQTRVYVDGLPLFNPVHGAGVLTGVHPDAIGAASFHPGGRSAAVGEGAAGVLDLTTRSPTAPGPRLLAELTVLSARAAGDWRSPGGRTSLMVAARRSYVDLATRIAESLGSRRGTYVPYAFHDIVARADADVGRGWGLEASGLWSQDNLRGGVTDLLKDTRGSWGNALARVSLFAPLGRTYARATVGASRFEGDLDRLPPAVTTDDAPSHAPTFNRLGVTLARLEIVPSAGGAGGAPHWAVGAEVTDTRQTYLGQYPRPYPVIVLRDSLVMRERLRAAAVWGEHRWPLGRVAVVEGGLRLEVRDRVRNARYSGLAPRVAMRVSPWGSRVTFSAAVARSWQYTQAIAPAGPSIGPDLYATDVWLLAGDTIPAIRADVATLGAEAWFGDGWIASVHGYVRRATGLAVPEPAPGTLTNQRRILVNATNLARGVEVSVRHLVGRWTTSLSYALGFSELEAPTGTWPRYAYASPADRRHALDATVMTHLPRGFRLGAAATAATGAPFSRFLLGVAPCPVPPGACTSSDTTALAIEGPNAERAPSYLTLDLLADWTREWRRVRIGAFVQLRNLWSRANAVTYTGSVEQCTREQPPKLVFARPGVCDRFERGIGFLPLAGVRAAF